MKFDETTHKVIPETLTKKEATAFIKFLLQEIERHVQAIRHAELEMSLKSALSPFYKSANLRHHDDIVKTQKVINKVKERFSL